MITRAGQLLLAAAAAMMLATAARAQTGNVPIPVDATIDAVLAGAAIRDLDFAYVTPAIGKTVTPADAAGCAGCTSGKWSFTNLFPNILPALFPQYHNASLTFTQLPAALTSPSGATLPLSWTNAAKACLVKNGVEYFCYAAYTPVQGVARLHIINGAGAPAGEPAGGALRSLAVYLGGTATPAAGQRAGYYTGTITLQFAYSN